MRITKSAEHDFDDSEEGAPTARIDARPPYPDAFGSRSTRSSGGLIADG
jgi:hypothetical protein